MLINRIGHYKGRGQRVHISVSRGEDYFQKSDTENNLNYQDILKTKLKTLLLSLRET